MSERHVEIHSEIIGVETDRRKEDVLRLSNKLYDKQWMHYRSECKWRKVWGQLLNLVVPHCWRYSINNCCKDGPSSMRWQTCIVHIYCSWLALVKHVECKSAMSWKMDQLYTNGCLHTTTYKNTSPPRRSTKPHFTLIAILCYYIDIRALHKQPTAHTSAGSWWRT